MLSLDYNQIELRIMAHYSRDEGLCTLLRDGLTDPFCQWAAQWHELAPDQAIPCMIHLVAFMWASRIVVMRPLHACPSLHD